MKKKRIHIVVKYFFPVTAGIEVNIHETYSVLAKNGWDITIHTTKDTLTESNILSDRQTIKGLKVKRYRSYWYGFFPKIQYETADMVCLHNFNIVPHLYILLRTLYKKIMSRKNYVLILTSHGGFNPEWSMFVWPISAVKRVYHATIGTFLINQAVDIVRAVSEWEKEELIKAGIDRQRVKVISNGIETQASSDINKNASLKMKKNVKGFGRYIIQIGRIYKIKNYETTIRALTILPKDINYVIVGPIGNEKYYQYLKKLIQELHLENRVIFMGVIRGADKYYLIKKAQMMVHMAHWESFCNVVHEGMSQGLVCIVSNTTALPYLVKNNLNGFCVNKDSYHKAAEKILYVLKNKKNKKIRSIMHENEKFAKEHSWNKVALKMEHLYLSQIEKNNSHLAFQRESPLHFAVRSHLYQNGRHGVSTKARV